MSHAMKPQTPASHELPANAGPRRFASWLLAACAGLLLLPGTASAFWNHDWSYRKEITLNAGPQGANVTAELSDVPVLIRLHEGVFKFSDANPDGSDLRFVAADDKTPLKFHIEKFDSVFNLAFIWVQMPQIKPGEPTKLWVYYGNANVTSGSDPRGTYDPNQTLVYHFGERGTPATDSTGFGNNAKSPFATEESGLIGNAAKFDGQSAIAVPASPSLAIAAGGQLTWSAWINPAAAGSDAVLYAQRDGTRALLIGLNKGAPYVSITGDSGAAAQSTPGTPLASGWHQLALLAGSAATLYIDGQPGPTLAATLPALNAGATLGGDGGQAGAPVASGFKGEMDELEISKTQRDAASIRLAAGNQGTEDKLIQFGVDEAQSTWSTGYVGIILGSVTLDGWVIIGILIVMALISWVVMARKGVQIQRAASGNKLFMNLFRSTGGDFGALNHLADGTAAAAGIELSERQRQLVLGSPLQGMFQAGIAELRQRLSREIRGRRKAYLSAQSIEAIRASIEATFVEELQALNKQMVLLTIAIAGGPFIGLLGTVVGVMITFAAVAASGDVNINAIAPGIAAALAATVAGLFVAIPALFGYNYLITRIKESSALMQVFVNTFVTRMAENYNASDELLEMAE